MKRKLLLRSILSLAKKLSNSYQPRIEKGGGEWNASAESTEVGQPVWTANIDLCQNFMNLLKVLHVQRTIPPMIQLVVINSLRNNKILDWSKLNAFADDNLCVNQK